MSMFSQPTGGGYFRPAEHEGHLILVLRTHGFDRHFDRLKDKEIDRATVDCVDLTAGGRVMSRVYFTHAGMVNKLSLDSPVLGRIGKVKAEKGDAWSLNPYEEGVDDKVAERWLASQGQGNAAPAAASTPVAARVNAAPAAASSPTLDSMRRPQAEPPF